MMTQTMPEPEAANPSLVTPHRDDHQPETAVPVARVNPREFHII